MEVNLIKKYQNLFVSKSENKSKQGRLSQSKFLMIKPKMAQFSQFKFLNALKSNFNGGQFNK